MSTFQFIRGDDVTIPITMTGVDLTGSTVFFTAKLAALVNAVDATDTNAVIKAQQTTHVDAVNGKTTIVLTGNVASPANTTSVTPGDYSYDIQTKDVNGIIQTRTNGPQTLTVLPDVTQRTT